MKIVVNGDAREVAAQTLDRVLSELGYQDSIVATALNGEFVAKAARREQRLLEGDRVEIVAPMQGG
jgi:sulfur carrier protein